MIASAFPAGDSRLGIWPFVHDLYRNGVVFIPGKIWYADAKQGSDNRSGKSWQNAFQTLSKVFEKVKSSDVVFLRGKFREESLETPAGVFDVTLIGASNNPRHADDHTETTNLSGGASGCVIMPPASPTAATYLIRVQQQGWKFVNILFDCPVDAAAVQLFRNAAADDDERDASHAQFIDCRFSDGFIGIENNGGAGHVIVEGCRFYGMTGSGSAGIKCTSTSVAVPLRWVIRNNEFTGNTSHILSSFSSSIIRGNTFGVFSATLSVDIQNNGAQGSENVIWGNYLAGTYGATAYPPGTDNEWAGNFNGLTGGLTADDPV